MHESSLTFRVVAALLCAVGFCACLVAYYPGTLSPDSNSMYEQARNFSFIDWYSPVLALIWAPIQLLVPGPQGMLFFLLTLYWGALLVFANAAATIDPRTALAMPLLGVMPFTVNFAGTIWTDVLVAVSWLMCAALVFHSRIHGRRMSAARQAIVWSFFLCGSWARPNALFAAVPLGFYLLEPTRAYSFAMRAALTVVLLAGLWLGSQVIFYAVLSAKRTHPINSILVFDLAGISHFSGKNYFPSTWSDEENAKILSVCYNPAEWDSYNPRGECSFVFRRMDDSGLWDSSGLWRPWFAAVGTEPLAYLRHRASHFLAFMTDRSTSFFHQGNSRAEASEHLQRNFGFRIASKYVFGAARFGIYRPVFWLVLGFFCVAAAPLCSAPSRRLVATLGLSSVVYLATYFFVGVASDFRYAYWAILATGVAALVLACELTARKVRRPQNSVCSELAAHAVRSPHDFRA
jgi:hypothetical protein